MMMKKLVLAALLAGCVAFGVHADSNPRVIITTASTNATSVQNGPTRVTMWAPVNTTATIAYIHVYDVTTVGFACGGVTEKHIIPVPASATGAGIAPPMTEAELYSSGLNFCVTGSGAAGDTSNAVAGVYVNYAFR